jgi:H+/Cl- antiporter ClcA
MSNESQKRLLLICTLSIALGIISTVVARVLLWAIAFFTNLFYFQKISLAEAAPGANTLGWWAILVPIIGGVIVGLMARYGSPAIRGHGIPEAMENILLKESRIPKRIAILKPLSAAVSIGSGGPFGAEGPIIATGGALGSMIGQFIPVSKSERKILLAAGAAAGMAAIFGTPFAAVLLAIELLLFEFRPKSFIPVALAAVMAATLRSVYVDKNSFMTIPDLLPPDLISFAVYLLSGLVIGVLSVIVTKSIYFLEDHFERIPIHWMWWPAIGGIFVGIIGVIEPRSLGVGYGNIQIALDNKILLWSALSLLVWKFFSWALALSSGTSGGTLAPLLTIGALFGLILAQALKYFFPDLSIDVHVMALIGMAGLFAGASRSLLASVVFALEATRQPIGIIPLLGACSLAYLVSVLMMENSIMTEKIVRRGVKVPHEYYPPETSDK